MTGIWDDELDRAERIDVRILDYIDAHPDMSGPDLRDEIMRVFCLDEATATKFFAKKKSK